MGERKELGNDETMINERVKNRRNFTVICYVTVILHAFLLNINYHDSLWVVVL